MATTSDYIAKPEVRTLERTDFAVSSGVASITLADVTVHFVVAISVHARVRRALVNV